MVAISIIMYNNNGYIMHICIIRESLYSFSYIIRGGLGAFGRLGKMGDFKEGHIELRVRLVQPFLSSGS
jgi:hypothetical protein